VTHRMTDDSLAIGIDLGGTTFAVGLFDRRGQKVTSASHPTPQDTKATGVFQAIVEAIEELLREQDLDSEVLAGVGIGIPGRVDPPSGVIKNCPNLPVVNEVNAVDLLGEALGKPVCIANDAFCATLAELRYGAGREVANLLLLTLGTGIGGGIALNNRVVRGPRQLMGEIGHMTIVPQGRRCGCGNFGCLEAVAAKEGIIELALRRLQAGRSSLLEELSAGDDQAITPQLIAQAAQQGDEVAGEVIAQVGNYIGIALCNAIVLLDPDLVLIGGGIAAAGEVLFEPIRRTVAHRSCLPQFDPAKIIPAELGNEAGVYGTAALVWETPEDRAYTIH